MPPSVTTATTAPPRRASTRSGVRRSSLPSKYETIRPATVMSRSRASRASRRVSSAAIDVRRGQDLAQPGRRRRRRCPAARRPARPGPLPVSATREKSITWRPRGLRAPSRGAAAYDRGVTSATAETDITDPAPGRRAGRSRRDRRGAGGVPDAVRRRLSTLDNWLDPYSWLVTGGDRGDRGDPAAGRAEPAQGLHLRRGLLPDRRLGHAAARRGVGREDQRPGVRGASAAGQVADRARRAGVRQQRAGLALPGARSPAR